MDIFLINLEKAGKIMDFKKKKKMIKANFVHTMSILSSIANIS